jgi:hypothetical protein
MRVGNTRQRRCLWLCVLVLLTSHQLRAQLTSVLFIGNSYTNANDLPGTFQQLALSLGDTVNVAVSAPGGFTLATHTAYGPTQDAIDAQPWDFVVLQEQGQYGALIAEGAVSTWSAWSLCNAIESNYECTMPVFFMTWGWESGAPVSCLSFPSMCTYEGMQQNLREGYIQLATDNDAYTAPVGVAWKQVRYDHPTIDLYQADGSHPTAEGTYLAACVFYCTVYKQPCTGAPFLSTVAPATATILQDIATATVLDSLDAWNLNVPSGTDALFTTNTDADEITCYHPGQGAHNWICSNGETSTSNYPTFSFDSAGTYLITHIYSDPCGNSDTVALSFDIIVAGINDPSTAGHYHVSSNGPSLVEVTGAKGTEVFTLFDPQGRTILSRRLNADRTRVPCPQGLHLFRIVDRTGALWSGKVLVE